MNKSEKSQCPLCLRISFLTFHHLIPRKVHRRAFFKKHYTKQQLNQGIEICRTCHNGIHRRFDEMTLAKQFQNKEALLANEELARFFYWVSKQKIS